jgi:hypothetical protein
MVAFGIPTFARAKGMWSLMGVAGTPTLIKSLLANGFPVMVDQWVSSADHTDHYRTIEAYDDVRQVFVASDPLKGPGYVQSYAEFESTWQVNFQRFYVVYPPAKHGLLTGVLRASGWDPASAFTADALNSRTLPNAHNLGDGLGPGYDYLNLAWDQVELGDFVGARRALDAARTKGARSQRVDWVLNEMDLRASVKTYW